VARDPYESTAEYQARVAQAYAVFQRRESEFYARNTRTYVVSVPVKGVKYDADRRSWSSPWIPSPPDDRARSRRRTRPG